MPESAVEPYDEIPYPSYVHNQTHPDRLAVIGTLLGMCPAPVDHCRVLELGCGDGSNLIPMAMSLGESEFIGIDRAALPIQKGMEAIACLGLKNVSLKHLDLLDMPADSGDFDYVIAHGLYAWVPDRVKDKIMSICRSHLKPQGIAFISYNAYPGSHISDMLRNMLLFHLRNIRGPKQRITQSIAFLKFLAESQTASDNYSALLKDELNHTMEFEPALLYHDRIGAVNTPVYFFQFVEHAAQYGLKFVGEADFSESQSHIYPPETVRLLARMAAESVILKEQYLDFLKCRRFRQTLLCHSEVKLAEKADSRCIDKMYVASRAQPVGGFVDLSSGKLAEFVGPRAGKVTTDYPLAKAALSHLAKIYPQSIAFSRLLATARETIGETDDENKNAETLSEILLQIYATGILELYTRPANYVEKAGERPMASRLARFEIEHETVVTNLRHTSVEVTDEIGRQLLKLLDGTRTRAMLLDDLAAMVSAAAGGPDKSGTPLPENRIRELLAAELEINLQKLAKLALLVQ
jgi:methyltransferase-like protein/2-polyprenyl-3-methyl-5-hydroxy-6-metoxy-1,4-benzoquinol methylase